jgi:hypothetical protein
MVIAVAYTGGRWSEIGGLTPECVRGDTVNIDWKLYELNGRFGSTGAVPKTDPSGPQTRRHFSRNCSLLICWPARAA